MPAVFPGVLSSGDKQDVRHEGAVPLACICWLTPPMIVSRTCATAGVKPTLQMSRTCVPKGKWETGDSSDTLRRSPCTAKGGFRYPSATTVIC